MRAQRAASGAEAEERPAGLHVTGRAADVGRAVELGEEMPRGADVDFVRVDIDEVPGAGNPRGRDHVYSRYFYGVEEEDEELAVPDSEWDMRESLGRAMGGLSLNGGA